MMKRLTLDFHHLYDAAVTAIYLEHPAPEFGSEADDRSCLSRYDACLELIAGLHKRVAKRQRKGV